MNGSYDDTYNLSKLRIQAGLPQQCHQLRQQRRSWKVGLLGAGRQSEWRSRIFPSRSCLESGRQGGWVSCEMPSEHGARVEARGWVGQEIQLGGGEAASRQQVPLCSSALGGPGQAHVTQPMNFHLRFEHFGACPYASSDILKS